MTPAKFAVASLPPSYAKLYEQIQQDERDRETPATEPIITADTNAADAVDEKETKSVYGK